MQGNEILSQSVRGLYHSHLRWLQRIFNVLVTDIGRFQGNIWPESGTTIKTEVLWIGANKGRDEILCPAKDLKWVTNKVRALDVCFSADAEITMETNYSEKFTQVNQKLGSLGIPTIELNGKITVLKSLISSQLVYILSTLPTNHHFINDLNNLFFKFLSSGGGDNVKRDVMISDYSNGGLSTKHFSLLG